MSTRDNKAILRRLLELVVNERRLDLIGQVVASDFSVNGSPIGRDALRRAVERHHADYSAFHVTIQDMVAEGDSVAVRAVIRGTHTGEPVVGGISVPATGRQVESSWFGFFRVADGKITEELALGDDLGLLRQLGVLPVP